MVGMSIDPDALHRTVKLELDDGRAGSVEEAKRIAARYVLQVDVGDDISDDPVLQAMFLTTVNTAARAFAGGVNVRCGTDPELTAGWAAGRRLQAVIKEYGGTVTAELSGAHPTLVVGQAQAPIGNPVLYLTHHRWVGAVVTDPADRLPGSGHLTLAGILAAALGVSEMFQYVRGSNRAGYRDVGLSLWNPGTDWRDTSTTAGPLCTFLPSQLAIMGLGHLGQAVCWALGFLPYANPRNVKLLLQDFDTITDANVSTGLLTRPDDIGQRKTRVVARCMEDLGVETTIVERRVDANTRRTDDEPLWAIAGFDELQPRRDLAGEAGYDRLVDIGLGTGTAAYLDILIHTFPGRTTPAQAWPASTPSAPQRLLNAAYEQIHEAEVRKGVEPGHARCGVVQLASRSAAASFVGAAAACLAVSEVVRALNGGPAQGVPSNEIISVTLANPSRIEAITNETEPTTGNPGFCLCACRA
jgi:hypothetical protein